MTASLLVLLLLGLLEAVKCELVELSYTFNVDAPSSPKLTPFRRTIVKKGENKYGIWIELNDFSSSEHAGTHLDAPVHFSRDGWKLHEIPTRRLWRIPAVMIDMSERVKEADQKNYGIRSNDLMVWEKENGPFPDGALVLIRTGWGDKSANIGQYSGIDENNKLNFPGLSTGAAKWLADYGKENGQKIGVVGVGIDTISIDVGQSVNFTSHVILCSQNIYLLENLANLDKLPPKGFYVTALPMRIGGGSGAPARIIAEVNEPPLSGAQLTSAPSSFLLLLVALALAMPFHGCFNIA